MTNALDFIFPFLFVLGVAAVIGAVVYVILRLRAGEPVLISLALLLRIYLYLVSLVSLMVLVGGLAALVNAGLGQAFGREFSYRAEYRGEPIRVLEPGSESDAAKAVTEEEQRQQREDGLARAARRGLINGVSTTIVAAIFFGAHWVARRALESPEERRRGYLNRAYVFLLLVIFGVGTIISLPQALVQSISFGLEATAQEYYRQPPGEMLATALVFVPFWLYYLLALLRQVRRGEE